MASDKSIALDAILLEEVSQAAFCRLLRVITIQKENTSSNMNKKKSRYSNRNLKREPTSPRC
jgi:hypothetical protein